MPRKSPVKIAYLCKNVLAGQPLAVDFFFFVTNFFFKTIFNLFQYNNNNTVSS